MTPDIHEHGFALKKQFTPDSIIDSIISEVEANTGVYPSSGIRHADKKFTAISELASSETYTRLAGSILGSHPVIVRVIYFDKTPDKNWLVTWHQDKTITVSQQLDLAGWGPWSVKDNILHVQPPLDVLQSMVTFRLHLDDADKNNGCLNVIPGSHRLGIMSQDEIANIISKEEHILCEVHKGDLLVMRPHLLHASSKAINPVHRRIVHIEYSNYNLPDGLAWG